MISYRCDEKMIYFYETFIGIRLHFRGKYDFFKYSGRLTGCLSDDKKIKEFSESSESKLIARVVKRLNTKIAIVEFILSNLVVDNHMWLDSFHLDYAERNYLNWKKVQESLTYRFKSDMSIISTNSEGLNDALSAEDKIPIVLELLSYNKIRIESVAILHWLTKFLSQKVLNVKNDIIYEDMVNNVTNYLPWVINYHSFDEEDKKKFSKIVLDKF